MPAWKVADAGTETNLHGSAVAMIVNNVLLSFEAKVILTGA